MAETLSSLIRPEQAPVLPDLDHLAPPPPLNRVAAEVEARTRPGDIVVDLFGRGAWVARAAMGRQRRAFTFESSALTRLLAEIVLRPPDVRHFDAALASLAYSPLGEASLRQSLSDLFASRCATCGRATVVDEFIWESDGIVPFRKVYRCLTCRDQLGGGEIRMAATDASDAERAVQVARGEPARLALRARFAVVAGIDSLPDEILGLYTPRTLTAIQAIVHRLDSDLRAAPIEAALRLALLHVLLPASRLNGFPGRVSSLRVAGGHLRPPAHRQWRERNPWLLFEEGCRLVRGFVQQLEATPGGPVLARLGEDPLDLVDGTANAVIRRGFPDAGEEGGLRLDRVRDRRIRLALTQSPLRWTGDTLALAYHATSMVLGRLASATLPLEELATPAARVDWGWHASTLARGLATVGPMLAADGRAVVLLDPIGAEGLVAGALAGAAAGYRLAGAFLEAGDQVTGGTLEFIPGAWHEGSAGRQAVDDRAPTMAAGTDLGEVPRAATGGTPGAGEPTAAGEARAAGGIASAGALASPEAGTAEAGSAEAGPAEAELARTAAAGTGAADARVTDARAAETGTVGPGATGEPEVTALPDARWIASPTRPGPALPAPTGEEVALEVGDIAVQMLQARGEPADFSCLLGDILVGLDEAGLLARYATAAGEGAPAGVGASGGPGAVPPGATEALLEAVRGELDRTDHRRLWQLEPGRWWLRDARDGQQAGVPLSDRVEWAVFSLLSATGGMSEAALYERIAGMFRGYDRPDPALVRACINSYRARTSTAEFVRTNDELQSRYREHTELIGQLVEYGHRLGLRCWVNPHERSRLYRGRPLEGLLSDVELRTYMPIVVRGSAEALDSIDCIWYLRSRAAFLWEVEWTAMLAEPVLRRGPQVEQTEGTVRFLVIPHERVELVRFKLERSPLLRAALAAGNWHFLKWKHLWAIVDREGADLERLAPFLGLNPDAEQQGQQMPLFGGDLPGAGAPGEAADEALDTEADELEPET
jgi:hypothetical protein